jgi:hypothetical protein
MIHDEVKSTTLTKLDYEQLKLAIQSVSFAKRPNAIVNEPFKFKVAMAWLFLGFICLYILDDKTAIVQLKAATDSEHYRLSVERYKFTPEEYRLSLTNDSHNTIIQSIAHGKPETTDDWLTLSRPNTHAEAVRLNQANSGIACSVVYPLSGKVRGALMYNYYQYPMSVGEAQRSFMRRYTKLASEYLY